MDRVYLMLGTFRVLLYISFSFLEASVPHGRLFLATQGVRANQKYAFSLFILILSADPEGPINLLLRYTAGVMGLYRQVNKRDCN